MRQRDGERTDGDHAGIIDVGLERAAFLHVADLQVNGTARGAAGASARGDNGATNGVPPLPIDGPKALPILTCICVLAS